MGFIEKVLGRFGYKKSYNLKNPLHVAELFKNFYQTHSGLSVNQETALKFSAYYAPLMQRARAIMVLPKRIMRQSKNGPVPFTSHDQYHLLTVKPNKYQTSRSFFLQFAINRINKGNGVAWLEGMKSFRGRPTAWHLMNPKQSYLYFENGDPFIVYDGKFPNGKKLDGARPYHEFIHVANDLKHDNDSQSSLWGRGLFEVAGESIGLGLGAEKMTGEYIQKNGFLSKYFQHPERLSEEDRDTLADSLMEYAPGGRRQDEIPLFDSNMALVESKLNLAEIEPNVMRRFAVEESARYHMFPSLFKLGHQDNSNYANSYQSGIEHKETTVDPDISPVMQELDVKIMKPSEVKDPEIYVHFETKGFLNADPEMRGKFYKAIGLTINRALKIEDMPTYGPEGDVLTTQVQNIPVELLHDYWTKLIQKIDSDMTADEATKFFQTLIATNNGQSN